MLVTVYKYLQGAAPSYLRTYLQGRDAGFYELRGYAKLKPPTVRTTRFGLHSFLHLAANVWNKLPDTTRKADTLSKFPNIPVSLVSELHNYSTRSASSNQVAIPSF